MKAKKIVREIGLIAFHLIPFIYLLMIYKNLPDVVATHFDIRGVADGFSSKSTLVWILAALNGFGYLLFLVIPLSDPKKFAEKSASIYLKVRIGMSVLFVALSMLMVYMSNGDPSKGIIMLALIFAALCIFLGNYFQAVKPNYFIGIRTPWTLNSDDIWRQTHLVTGKLMFFGGILSLPVIFLLPPAMSPFASVSVLVGASVFSIIYSFVLFKKEKNASTE